MLFFYPEILMITVAVMITEIIIHEKIMISIVIDQITKEIMNQVLGIPILTIHFAEEEIEEEEVCNLELIIFKLIII